MTAAETAELIAILREYYPRDVESTSIKAKVKAWHMILQDWDYELVKAAAVAFVSSDDRGFMPAPGQILDKIKTLAETGALPAGEAWRLVSDAVTRCDRFNPAKEYNKLPPEVQRAVGSPQMLVEWGNVDPQSFQTVIASNFRRAYDTRQKREQEIAVLPESVRRVIGELSDRLSLSSRENEKRGLGGCKHD